MTSGHIVTGSSPLTRGKPPYRSWWGASLLAHPRSRGENPRGVEAHVPSSGSSPLTRGKQSSRKPPEIVIGLIPAHAGKTPRRGRLRRACPAHPRSRGENAGHQRRSRRGEGSSPLTRGKPHSVLSSSIGRRLIPAHAGKTVVADTKNFSRAAHPRSRGENQDVSELVRLPSGSSPLTRGKPR